MSEKESKGMILMGGNSHPIFANLVAHQLGVRLADCRVFHYANRETGLSIRENVRGRDVYIVQTGTENVNNDIVELLMLVYAARTHCARRIVVAMPYLPYCNQAKMRKRGCVVSKLVARMLCRAGMHQLITMDLRAKEVQGFFDVPIDNLRASPFLIQYIERFLRKSKNKSKPDNSNVRRSISDECTTTTFSVSGGEVVAPTSLSGGRGDSLVIESEEEEAVIVALGANSVPRVSSFAERLRLRLAIVHGRNNENVGVPDDDMRVQDGRNSPPCFPAATSITMATSGGGARGVAAAASSSAQSNNSNRTIAQQLEQQSSHSKTEPIKIPGMPSTNYHEAPQHQHTHQLAQQPHYQQQHREMHQSSSSSAVVSMLPSPKFHSFAASPNQSVATAASFKYYDVSSSQRRRRNTSLLYAGPEMLPTVMAKEKPPLTLVGNVSGKIAILIKDVVEDADQFITVTNFLKLQGAHKILLIATHGLISAEAADKFEQSCIDQVVVCNTIPLQLQKSICQKIHTVDVSALISEAIRRIYNKESMSYLFQNIHKNE